MENSASGNTIRPSWLRWMHLSVVYLNPYLQLLWRRPRFSHFNVCLQVCPTLRLTVFLCPSFTMSCFSVSGYQIPCFLVIVLTLINASTAFRALTNTSFASTNLTIPCVGALSADIACSPTIAALSLGEYYPEETLSRTCTADCARALVLYANRVATACDKQTWKGYEDTDMPLAIIPDMLRYHYNLTCLMDSGRYCNTIAGKAAAALDPEGTKRSLDVSYNLLKRRKS